ncbi:helix-turn-helix domain-containing protein [Pseudomonas syringae]|uniref:helix-turn-helix domain-containing protein n=1 Tax=Pseudomonas syringae TaxID=317 RepID=UPI001F38AA0F|nr:XRE family transcriptional regulator [Pseudomonas syringae]
MNNIEHAKSSVTLSTLENLAAVLDIDPVALLAVASSHDKKLTSKEFLKYLVGEIGKLEKLGVLETLDGEFKDGKLDPVHSRIRSSALNRAAVQKCKAEGKTQKEAAELLGLGKATVSRLWKDKPPIA